MGISSFIGQPSLSDDYDSRERARVKLKIPGTIEWQKILIYFFIFLAVRILILVLYE